MKHRTQLTTALILSLSGAAMLAAGCQQEKQSQSEGAAPKGEVPQAESEPPKTKLASALGAPEAKTTPTAKVHMQEHLRQAEQLRVGVQLGELETTRAAAAWLAEHELTSNLSEKWKPYVEMMRNAAHSARDAKDLASASAAIGLTGEACASCHRGIAGPKVEASTPPTGSGLKAQMALHAWAAQQMWLGLMAPSDEAWVRGAEAMAKAELAPEELFNDRSAGPTITALEQTAVKIASEASSVQDMNATDKRRGELYGQLLATCSACHAAVKAEKGL